MSDDNWEFLIGFSAMVFAIYPMAKDVINEEKNASFAFLMSMILAAMLTKGFLWAIKKIKRSQKE